MFSFFESEETKRLKSHITNLGALAKVDGHMDQQEMEFIMSIGRKHGLKKEDVQSLLANSATVQPHVPTNDMERFDQIYDLVEMMLSDGIVDESEMEFCVNMATKLGFNKSIVGMLVSKILVGVKDGLTREYIRKETQAMLNN